MRLRTPTLNRTHHALTAGYWLPAILIGFQVCSLGLAASPRPNILFIVGDDMGYADAGFQGCKDIPTPNLDALAASCVRFTSGYVSGPYCSPTRAGLMTGRYQTRFGHEFNPSGGSSGLPLTERTIADRLKAAGYVTGLVGKWHLGAQPNPVRHGVCGDNLNEGEERILF